MHTIFPRFGNRNHAADAALREIGAVSVSRLFRNTGRILALWRERSGTRRALSRLDAAGLRDIGINHLEAAREAAKPFWRA